MTPKIAIIGEGVIGCSTALQVAQAVPDARVTVLSDRPFEQTCSFGPAGLFRIDDIANREFGKSTFDWFAHLHRTEKGDKTGVKLLSGHIQSDSKERLEQQQKAYGDIVYNFRFLEKREILDLFPNPSEHCIHYTAFASEGNKYVPYLKFQCQARGVEFLHRKVRDLEELANEGYDVIVNCAGLSGGTLAGDDDSVYPIRGVVLDVEAHWHKHFNYKDFITFTIPKENSVVIGSVKQENRWDLEITDVDRKDILERYVALHPAMREPKILGEWSGLRPARKTIRIEKVEKKSEKSGKKYTVVHHYGHGGNGFTLGWGTAVEATKLVKSALNSSKL
ncbi:D-aspartate oxidase 1 [Caenorhabditis elegans]|uniref:D-aspartate oxidase 1 n=1 Tax=Caenorhabditis elegans TaxID=6239 RepID=OXDD1_CAEEL|nr:D-aspartate oxidase 1 [Caenorhabditis elegans]O45307.2 RecName: Full=D-aspartate oxidase 1; Short=DASOX 1; Short=DDO-1 [Caenorhabditis elegans]BAF34314.1 D-aspartate oxidase [Caenorhabditis elegans]CAB03970.2 D-aspartate oxidase 1 [Caenorhabditis elegans]|eukprot:NP_001256757.1 D-aspartate oxidase 1 [Caenorhabditis elegans]